MNVRSPVSPPRVPPPAASNWLPAARRAGRRPRPRPRSRPGQRFGRAKAVPRHCQDTAEARPGHGRGTAKALPRQRRGRARANRRLPCVSRCRALPVEQPPAIPRPSSLTPAPGAAARGTLARAPPEPQPSPSGSRSRARVSTIGAAAARPAERAPAPGYREGWGHRGPGPRALGGARNVPTKLALMVMTSRPGPEPASRMPARLCTSHASEALRPMIGPPISPWQSPGTPRHSQGTARAKPEQSRGTAEAAPRQS